MIGPKDSGDDVAVIAGRIVAHLNAIRIMMTLKAQVDAMSKAMCGIPVNPARFTVETDPMPKQEADTTREVLIELAERSGVPACIEFAVGVRDLADGLRWRSVLSVCRHLVHEGGFGAG